MEKYCKKCDTTKPVSEFHKSATYKDGLGYYCRQCISQKSKEYYKKNCERLRAESRQSHRDNPNYVKEWREKNPDYHKEWKKKNPDYHKEWNQKNPDKLKEYAKRKRPRKIERTYGITIERYNDLLDQQNNRCAICREENESGRALSVDHDHSCCKGNKSCGECVRQLLCLRCNMMLGHARDDIEILKAAQKYLERHSRPKNLAKNLD